MVRHKVKGNPLKNLGKKAEKGDRTIIRRSRRMICLKKEKDTGCFPGREKGGGVERGVEQVENDWED